MYSWRGKYHIRVVEMILLILGYKKDELQMKSGGLQMNTVFL